jgi:hypothetical protein
MPKGKKKFRRSTSTSTSHEANVTTGATDHSSKPTKRKHKSKHKRKAAQVSKEGALVQADYVDKGMFDLYIVTSIEQYLTSSSRALCVT